MRISALISVTGLMLSLAFFIGCSQAENKTATAKPTAAPPQTAAPAVLASASPSAKPIASNTAPLPPERLRNLPPEGGEKPIAAEFNGYPYSYKKDGEKTVATFGPRLLPWDKEIVDGAVRDVIYRSYGDRADAAPHIEGTGSARTIRIAAGKHQYTIVPVTEPNGEIKTLIITRLN